MGMHAGGAHDRVNQKITGQSERPQWRRLHPLVARIILVRRIGFAIGGTGELERDAHPNLDLIGHIGVFAEKDLRILFALAQPQVAVRVPGPGLLDDVVFGSDVDEQSHVTDSLVVHDVEFGLPERRRRLVPVIS